MFLVICTDENSDTDEQEYYLATHTVFREPEDAHDYMSTIDVGRKPLVVNYDGQPLRDDYHLRTALHKR
jgi:hypothetical protein